MARDPGRLEALLAGFTTDELLDEVARRMRALRAKAEGETLCEGCRHVVFWTKRGDPPDSFNTCALRHTLEFKMPEDVPDEDYGFYRPGGCRDRAEPPPPPPAPARPPMGGKPVPVPSARR